MFTGSKWNPRKTTCKPCLNLCSIFRGKMDALLQSNYVYVCVPSPFETLLRLSLFYFLQHLSLLLKEKVVELMKKVYYSVEFRKCTKKLKNT